MTTQRVQIAISLEELTVLLSLSEVQGARVFAVVDDPITGQLRIGIECDQLKSIDIFADPPLVRPRMELHAYEDPSVVFRRLDWNDALAKHLAEPIVVPDAAREALDWDAVAATKAAQEEEGFVPMAVALGGRCGAYKDHPGMLEFGVRGVGCILAKDHTGYHQARQQTPAELLAPLVTGACGVGKEDGPMILRGKGCTRPVGHTGSHG